MPPKQGPPTPRDKQPASTTSAKQKSTAQSQEQAQAPSSAMDFEYTQRLLSLFTSFYDEPSIEEISSIKDIELDPLDEPITQPRAIPFYSAVWDLRLRKVVDAKLASDQLASDALSEQVLQLRESLANETPDLNDVFVPKNIERPEIPTYLKYMEEDEKKLNDFSHQRAKPSNLNFQQNSRIFTEKLRRQKASSKERAKRRFIKARQVEKGHNEFVNTLYKSQFSGETNRNSMAKGKYRAIQEQKEKQLREGVQTMNVIRSKSPSRKPPQ
ncbi:hypothetical protein M9Y10_027063 [Tritrichomonas musculus]|uniref:Uncharacterized protein n=1 Tax=Tritrichomonas musculus TaxID=1915356 RepID=A0ABR2H7T3_9EUKA